MFSLAMLVTANLVPLAGVLFLGWSVFDLLLLFWMENIVIGVFNVLRMGVRLVSMRDLTALFLIPFFAFHYGAFTAGHGFFILAMFGARETFGLGDAGFSPFGAFIMLERLLESQPGYLWGLGAMVLSHGFSFLVNFIGRGEFRHVDAGMLMHAPYPRIVVLHVTIILGGIITQALGQPLYAFVLLVLIKITIDALEHLRERKRQSGPPQIPPVAPKR